MQYFDQYLHKHNHSPIIKESPNKDTSITLVIPCLNEPDIITTLESLWKCDNPTGAVEVIIVLNYPENSDQAVIQNHTITLNRVHEWTLSHTKERLKFHIIDAPNLPKKFAGVGLARKIGMDEALSRYSYLNNPEGIICGFDADSTTDNNYFTAIEAHFKENPKSPGASIYFEHPIDNIEDLRLKNGIIQYELHLRYLVRSIAFTGFPYAYHTVGSSFAVKAIAYVKQGGMNRFKAGEDFYFLNKIMPLGGYTEINTTRVMPQARISNRVPFGTGASMTKWMECADDDLLTYQFKSFLPLKTLFQNIEKIYQLKSINEDLINNPVLWQFLKENDSDKAINEVLDNSSSLAAFTKRFFNWFDAFKIVKYLNFATLSSYPKKPVKTEATKLLSQNKEVLEPELYSLLKIYRKWDKIGIDKE